MIKEYSIVKIFTHGFNTKTTCTTPCLDDKSKNSSIQQILNRFYMICSIKKIEHKPCTDDDTAEHE